MAERTPRKNLRLPATVLLFLFFGGCTGRAKLWHAEGFVEKEGSFSVSTPERKSHFARACLDYLDVYRHNPQLFDLKKLRNSAHACFLAQDFESARRFIKFQDDYRAAHPDESLRNEPWISSSEPSSPGPARSYAAKPSQKPRLKPIFS